MAILLVFICFFSIGEIIIIKYTGEKVIAIVNKVPYSCDRYNHINVLIDSVDYEVSISRVDCKKSIYKVGQKVTLLKSKKYNKLVWPESQPELLPLIFVAVFILVYLSNKGRCKK